MGTSVGNDPATPYIPTTIPSTFGGGPSESRIPCGLSGVPFEWKFIGGQLPMELLGGFVGFAQDVTTLALRPAIGWAVREFAPRRAQARD